MRYVLFLIVFIIAGCEAETFTHENVTSTVFWIGEAASEENQHISNVESVWDDEWLQNYGGIDNPNKRSGFFPEFVPLENPFYIALPYNDMDKSGKQKQSAYEIPWVQEKTWRPYESMLKNHWVKLKKGDKIAFAQWEDVGPFGEDDYAYVFGKHSPKNTLNSNVGIDVSPAVRDYLELSDIDKVDWEFIDERDVPEGPWKIIVTRSQINWK